MGARGPVGKRSDQRLGHGHGEKPTDKAPGAKRVSVPRVKAEWHPVAAAWYTSLAKSGQVAFYEPSDWATAVLIAESISRDLNPQVVGVTDSGKVVTDVIPMKGASLTAYMRAMGVLMVTEGDRRRLQVELHRNQAGPPDSDQGDAIVTDIAARRARLVADETGLSSRPRF
jgi:hypothetical protein